jgi:hypothetical protein
MIRASHIKMVEIVSAAIYRDFWAEDGITGQLFL